MPFPYTFPITFYYTIYKNLALYDNDSSHASIISSADLDVVDGFHFADGDTKMNVNNSRYYWVAVGGQTG
jgi:hypothetical protein